MNVPATHAPTVVSARTLSTSSAAFVQLDMWEISARQVSVDVQLCPPPFPLFPLIHPSSFLALPFSVQRNITAS